MPKQHLEPVLEQLHADYQSKMVATLSWGGASGTAGAGDAGREFLADIVAHFWAFAGGAR